MEPWHTEMTWLHFLLTTSGGSTRTRSIPLDRWTQRGIVPGSGPVMPHAEMLRHKLAFSTAIAAVLRNLLSIEIKVPEILRTLLG